MPKIIGIPCGLFYHKYNGLWQSFFDGLGMEVRLSGHTDRRVMDLGLKTCVNEACLPVKAYYGHVMTLKDNVDYLFVPRYLSIRKGEHVCPKFNGLPDMIRNSIPDLPPMIDCEINLIKKESAIYESLNDIAERLEIEKDKVRRAYDRAWRAYRAGLEKTVIKNPPQGRHRVLLLGHPYLVYDDYLNLNIREKLEKLGAQVLTLDMLSQDTLRRQAAKMDKRIFWSYGSDAIGLAYHLLEHGSVDGIISLSSFGCGIDSFVIYLAERRIKKGTDIPFFTVTLDEHAAEAGIDTRIEAFMDTVKRSAV